MKKWHIATAAVALAVAGAGLGASFAGATPPPRDPRVVTLPPAHVVVANPNWAPPAPARPRPATLPLAPALPAPTGPVLVSADFATADSSAWQSPLLAESNMAPLWLIQDGVVEQAGDVNRERRLEESYYLTGQPTLSNYVYDAAVLATSGEGAGLVWNVQGASFYRVQLLPNLPNSSAKAQLELVQAGRVTVLAQAPLRAYAGYTPYVWQTLRVQSSADRQQVWVNGNPLFDLQNGVLTRGQVGLFAWADSATRFDNVRVQTATSH